MVAKKTQKLTKYEMARILGARALQLSEGAPLAIKLSEKELETLNYDAYKIAKRELELGKLPIDVITKQRKCEVSEEMLRNEADLAKLERELNLAEIDDDEDGESAEKEKSDSDE